jgi:polyhydroxyalkanoate synthesis repressor PhaR
VVLPELVVALPVELLAPPEPPDPPDPLVVVIPPDVAVVLSPPHVPSTLHTPEAQSAPTLQPAAVVAAQPPSEGRSRARSGNSARYDIAVVLIENARPGQSFLCTAICAAVPVASCALSWYRGATRRWRLIVKKYSNRRLYDTEQSRYITQEELAEKIRLGADVRVIDAATGDDLTQLTLAQIILESRGASRLLPVPLLVQLIRMGDDSLAEFFGRYMSSALDLYLHAKEGAAAIAPYNPFVNVPFAATNALARLLLGGGGGAFGWRDPPAPIAAVQGPFPSPPPLPSPPPTRESSDEMKDLRRELDELKRALRPTRVLRAKPASGVKKRRP